MILWDSNLRCLPVCQKSVSLIGPKKRRKKKWRKSGNKDENLWAIGEDARKNSSIQEMTTEMLHPAPATNAAALISQSDFCKNNSKQNSHGTRWRHFRGANIFAGWACRVWVVGEEAKGARFLHVVNFPFLFATKCGGKVWRARKARTPTCPQEGW